MAKIGEVMLCSEHTQGKLESLQHFNGHTFQCVGGGFNKLYIVQASGKVTALDSPQSQVTVFNKLGKISDIKCGKYQTLVLTDGFIYSFGQGIFGVLGHGGAISVQQPQIIKALSDKFITNIACGEGHCLALTKSGDLYSWGRGYQGQLGIRTSIQVSSIPKYVDSFYQNPIQLIACGQRHSLAVDLQYRLYSWGQGRCGQLGRGKQRLCKLPTVVEISGEVQALIGGAGHSAVLTNKGKIYIWGLNNYGQLGLGDNQVRWYPTLLETDQNGNKLAKASKLVGAAYSTYCIDKFQNIYGWGRGYFGTGKFSNINKPTLIELESEQRQFAQIQASDVCFFSYSPLRIHSLSPSCGPATGGTKVTLIGTALAVTQHLKVRFKFGYFQIECECDYDSESCSVQVYTPRFLDEGQTLDLPAIAQVELTMDGVHYIKCDRQFLIYAPNMNLQSIQPKCASVQGGTELKLEIDLHQIQQEWLWHLSVGFMVKPKQMNINRSYLDSGIKREHDQSRISTLSAKAEDLEYIVTPGKYRNGYIYCKAPAIHDYDELALAYIVDISINGQQMTYKPLNFRYYQIQIQEFGPFTGFSDQGTVVRILGKGMYDSSAKRLRISNQYSSRDLPVQWDRSNKAYITTIPPVAWLFGSDDPDQSLISECIARPVKVQLTLNGIDYIQLPSFRYIDFQLVRASKVKIDESLSPEQKEEI